MPTRNIYFKDEDDYVFKEAQKISENESVSSIIIDALKLYIANKKAGTNENNVVIEIKIDDKLQKFLATPLDE